MPVFSHSMCSNNKYSSDLLIIDSEQLTQNYPNAPSHVTSINVIITIIVRHDFRQTMFTCFAALTSLIDVLNFLIDPLHRILDCSINLYSEIKDVVKLLKIKGRGFRSIKTGL